MASSEDEHATAQTLPAPSTPDGVSRPSQSPGGPGSLIGRVLSGRYRIERLLGEGAMGAVYLVEHVLMHKRLALKVLHAEISKLPEAVARFEREAVAAGHIDHPNVAAATDFGTLDDGSFFLVLEYVEGRSLRDALDHGAFDVPRTLHVVRQIAGALARAHGLGIVHRDLKPENIMLVERDGDPDFVKVLDFGIAKVPIGGISSGDRRTRSKTLTQAGMIYGTPEYMAPEQALGRAIDARADLYALGVILFELLAGRRPFDDDDKVLLLGMHVTAKLPALADVGEHAPVPEALDSILRKLLEKSPQARFGNAKELLAALDTMGDPARSQMASVPSVLVRTSITVSEILDSATNKLTTTPRKKLAMVAGGALALAFFGVLGLSLLFRGDRTEVRSSDGGWLLGARASASASAKPPRNAPPERLAAARDLVDHGETDAGVAATVALAREFPDDPTVLRLVVRGEVRAKSFAEAMRHTNELLASDPSAAVDEAVLADVRSAAVARSQPAFELLETRFGAVGVDALYDLAYGSPVTSAAAQARSSVGKSQVRAKASTALGVALDWRGASDCEAKRALLPVAEEQGDTRMLPLLRQVAPRSGCGFLGTRDCWPCLHRDGALDRAVTAVGKRPRK